MMNKKEREEMLVLKTAHENALKRIKQLEADQFTSGQKVAGLLGENVGIRQQLQRRTEESEFWRAQANRCRAERDLLQRLVDRFVAVQTPTPAPVSLPAGCCTDPSSHKMRECPNRPQAGNTMTRGPDVGYAAGPTVDPTPRVSVQRQGVGVVNIRVEVPNAR